VVRTTSPVAKLIPKNGWTMKRDPRVLASASDALQAAGSKGWGDVARGCPEPGGVQGRLELGDGAADEAGVLDPGVADLAQGLEGALQVDGQLIAQGEQLNADLVAWDPVPTVALGAGRALLGERRRGERTGGADDGGGGGGRAQEAPAAEPSHLLTTGGVVVTCAHA
jgi:hypothetical protein